VKSRHYSFPPGHQRIEKKGEKRLEILTRKQLPHKCTFGKEGGKEKRKARKELEGLGEQKGGDAAGKKQCREKGE